MEGLITTIEQCADQTKVCIRLVNCSSQIICAAAPDPYVSVWIFDQTQQPLPRVRAVRHEYSQKLCSIRPHHVCLMTVNLFPYWDEIRGIFFVRITFDVIRNSNEPHKQTVEGYVELDIPSFDEKLLVIKNRQRSESLPIKLFDASESTQFTEVGSDT